MWSQETRAEPEPAEEGPDAGAARRRASAASWESKAAVEESSETVWRWPSLGASVSPEADMNNNAWMRALGPPPPAPTTRPPPAGHHRRRALGRGCGPA